MGVYSHKPIHCTIKAFMECPLYMPWPIKVGVCGEKAVIHVESFVMVR